MKKNPVGRPIKTTANSLPENWKEIIYTMSAEGCSDVEIRAALITAGGIKSASIEKLWYALQEREEEFYLTIKSAKELCQAWWEKQGRENLNSKFFQTGCWYANMKNRFGWRDNKDVNLGVDNAEEYFKTIADAISRVDTNTNKILP